MFTYRDALDSEGLIARKRPGYERRPEQLAMAAEVDAAIREKRSLVVEAGTGVGKSFAYLVPAILYTIENQTRDVELDDCFPKDDGEADSRDPFEQTLDDASDLDAVRRFASEFGSDDEIERPDSMRRVVVSTHTISLQEQLFHKDVPFLNSILPFEFTVALAKGRANYVCKRRFESALKAEKKGTLFEEDRSAEIERIRKWLEVADEGSKSELEPAPASDVWAEINCEQGNCLHRKCKHYETCFYRRARRRLDSANLIVVNHALLFSDVAVRRGGGSILPPYDALVFDEAHTIEQVAAENLGVDISEYSVQYALSRLYNDRTNKGLLVEETSGAWSPERELFVAAAKLVDECRFRAERTFAELREWLDARPGGNGRVRESHIFDAGLEESLETLKNALRRASETLEDPGRRQEYKAAKDRLDALAITIGEWREQRLDGYAYWLESINGRSGRRVSMRAAPVDVSEILRESLFNVTPTVVATSATLTTGSGRKRRGRSSKPVSTEPLDGEETEETRKAFHFFRSRVGMTGSRARALGSPFDYREQMTLVLAKGLELSEERATRLGIPKDELAAQNERRLFSALAEYVEETDGGVFALFTNAAQMRRATAALSDFFALKNYPFFSQSNGLSRRAMTNRFKESDRAALFGVDSFWQGVDVPGRALRNVIIVKLPFLAPEAPLVEARLEAIRERGGNEFREYQLPSAILKFKQGVGRLIRTKSDVGQVVVLDERIHTKSYGRAFLSALPECKVRVDLFD